MSRSKKAGLGLIPFPIAVPPRLLKAFAYLKVRPVLVGGSAVQVWTGRREGLFATYDLDFVGAIRSSDLVKAGLSMEDSGRHAMVDGVAVEFPSGPLAVGDRMLSEESDALPVPTVAGDTVFCLRPEACVLDRLAWVAGDQLGSAYVQALAVAASQSAQSGWDQIWIEKAARDARLSKLWNHLKAELQSGRPQPEALAKVLKLGWD